MTCHAYWTFVGAEFARALTLATATGRMRSVNSVVDNMTPKNTSANGRCACEPMACEKAAGAQHGDQENLTLFESDPSRSHKADQHGRSGHCADEHSRRPRPDEPEKHSAPDRRTCISHEVRIGGLGTGAARALGPL